MKRLILATIATLSFAGAYAIDDPVQYVNPLVGSHSTGGLSTGNTYPAIALPWGMNFWTPQTGKMGDGWCYTYDAEKIRGFKQTHQPSPWMNDYAMFNIMPECGDAPIYDENKRASWFSHKAEVSKPHYYKVYLADYDITTEIAPTSRAAIFRFTMPAGKNFVIVDAFDRGSYVKVIPGENKVVGYTTRNSGGVPKDFKNYFVLQFDRPFIYTSTADEGKESRDLEMKSKHAAAAVGFQTTKRGEQINVRVASSFISIEQAEQNLKELAGKTLEEVSEAGRQEWNKVLSVIDVDDNSDVDRLRTFYSCLYRSTLFPRSFYEINAKGEVVHYSPYNGQVLPGYLFADTGFWDTFRALFPLVNLMYPSMSQKMQEGWANAFKESGFLPEWSAPGHRACMVGNNSASVVADAYLKGIRGYDIDALWEAVKHGANADLPRTTSGRKQWQTYNKLGYVPYDSINESAARTLEYAFDDWTVAQMAEALGETSLAKDFAERGTWWRNAINPETGYAQLRDSTGQFVQDFDPFRTGANSQYVEGNAWQLSYFVPQDVPGLVEVMGAKSFVERLDDGFRKSEPFRFNALNEAYWDYPVVQGNQQSMHFAYLFNWAGYPWLPQKWARSVVERYYGSGVSNAYLGDEDQGQMSAWFVMSALGLFQTDGGCRINPVYEIGSPLYRRAVIHLGGRYGRGKDFVIEARNTSRRNIYVQSATLNGKPLQSFCFPASELLGGGKLVLQMGPSPNRMWGK